jgi:hypothetical protein
LFFPWTVKWITNSISTNKCTIPYNVYFTTDFFLHVSVQSPSSGILHQCF